MTDAFNSNDSIHRFSNRVENYVRYRPDYPPEVVSLLAAECGLTRDSIIADVGSGTGILSGLFLREGNTVFGIEPNGDMRAAAERLLQDFADFQSRDGKAEATGLRESSVDFVTAGQAFHWFDQAPARQEFVRVLRPAGWVVLLWNERRLDSSPFLRDYEDLLVKFGTDYEQVRHENSYEDIASFFSGPFSLKMLDNHQLLDWEGLKGRTLSSSYVPDSDHPNYEAMLAELLQVFEDHQTDGKVIIEYDTKLYYGRLK